MDDKKDRRDVLRPDQPYCEKKLLSREELEEQCFTEDRTDRRTRKNGKQDWPATYDLMGIYETAMLPLLLECEALAARHGLPFFHLAIPVRRKGERFQRGAMMMRHGPGRDERFATLGRIMASSIPLDLRHIAPDGRMVPTTERDIHEAAQASEEIDQSPQGRKKCSCPECVARREMFADLREKYLKKD